MLRSSSFRLALLICGIVALAFAVSGLLTWQVMHRQLQELQDIRIRTVVSILEETYGIGGREAFFLVADQISSPSVANAPTISILDPGGALVAGDPLPFDPPPGWSILSGDTPAGLAYRVLRRELPGYSLIVAIETRSVDRAMAYVTRSTFWSVLAALSVALFGGGWAAGRIRRRQLEFQGVLDRIAGGDLAARLPLTSRDDDLNDLARGANAAFARLENAVHAMQQVSDDIAHDLRTPLSRLRLLASELQSDAGATAGVQDRIDEMIREIDGITETFTALLRISQIESGSRRERFEKLDLRSILGAIAETYEAVGEETGHAFAAAWPDRPVPIRGDRNLLVQALVNLVENAIRHTPSGTRIRCTVTDDPVPTLLVEDDGPGIPAAERDRVVQRLYRRDSSRATPGSGLGLTLVKAVGTLHGARLVLGDAHPGLHVSLTFPAGGGAGGSSLQICKPGGSAL